MSDLKENFLLKIRTISSGKIEEIVAARTRGKLGSFRLTVQPLNRGEHDTERLLQVTGWARSNGLLELRVGMADAQGRELGEQMVFETVRDIDPSWDEGFKVDLGRKHKGNGGANKGKKYKKRYETHRSFVLPG